MTRIVALGDSISFGVGDVRGDGVGPGWSGRLAAVIGTADHQRLAWPGARLSEMAKTQLAATCIAAPDIALVSIGGNDAIRRGFDADRFASQLRKTLETLQGSVPSVVALTLPDISRTCQIPRSFRSHLQQRVALLNAAILSAAGGTSTLILDRWTDGNAYLDSHLAADRVHPSPCGYQSLAESTAALLGLDSIASTTDDWQEAPRSRWWLAVHGLPWALKRSVRLVPSALSMLRQESGSRFTK
ncbi:MAG TPA: hypothetical protein DDY88_01600 [Actinobacteria bacterium]|nr:hypothetical protein [Actinomycetota bacterium]